VGALPLSVEDHERSLIYHLVLLCSKSSPFALLFAVI
jgi:hypothetical protein